MEKRLTRLEQALEELRAENRALRDEVRQLRIRLAASGEPAPAAATGGRSWRRAKWSVIGLVLSLVLVPVVALSVLHMNAFQSTTIAAMNAVLLYLVGPSAWRLLAEGLVRAIPAVLFGHATRIAIEKWRGRWFR